LESGSGAVIIWDSETTRERQHDRGVKEDSMIDPVLVNHLRSGQAWVLVGSGPSNEMQYPSWETLAKTARNAVKTERPSHDRRPLEKALQKKDYPQVFEYAGKILGVERLLQELRNGLVAKQPGRIYKMIAEWPVPVYLTTNYDDEIQSHLSSAGATFITYSNSKDDMSLLSPGLTGVIVKLHGTLRSPKGLILTTRQYQEIDSGEDWTDWRTKMTSIFQMSRMVVIGHSLTDNNIRHLLEAAKKGASVDNPICWIAPDVPEEEVKRYLEKYRIRVISYENRDGRHRNLVRLIENLSEFIPPRTTIPIKDSVARIAASPLGKDAAAPGFYVFNRLAGLENFEKSRVDVILAAMESAIPALSRRGAFTIKEAFELSGWPNEELIPKDFEDQVRTRALAEGLIVREGAKYLVGTNATILAEENRKKFEHMSSLFKLALELRVKNKFPDLTPSEARTISSDIETSLTGYFREGGLSLTTTLFSDRGSAESATVPTSIIKFVNESSAKYSSMLMRQAFSSTSIDAFVSAGPAEREYLGRICQGFFAYHSLGVFGELAVKRLEKAKETVWLVDSNALIPALALEAPTHELFADTLRRLNSAGVRFFTTDKLFREAFKHLGFAIGQITTHGADSPEVIAAAKGEAPFYRSNQFLQGFLSWRASRDLNDWNSYLYEIFGSRHPNYEDVKNTLTTIGVEVVPLDIWPGFRQRHLQEATTHTEEIVDIWSRNTLPAEDELEVPIGDATDWYLDPYKKAGPEAEALLITRHERDGTYHMIGPPETHSDAWFISDTSILNVIYKDLGVVTWPTIGFLRFASTLSGTADQSSADRAFQTLLLNCARSGLNILDEENINRVFGSRIDQDTIELSEELEIYSDTIKERYGDSPEAVLRRVSPTSRYMAAIQLANEAAQTQQDRLEMLEVAHQAALKRAEAAEKRLAQLARFEQQMSVKKTKGKRIARKQKAKQSKRKRK
jgi:hypothetical protein